MLTVIPPARISGNPFTTRATVHLMAAGLIPPMATLCSLALVSFCSVLKPLEKLWNNFPLKDQDELRPELT